MRQFRSAIPAKVREDIGNKIFSLSLNKKKPTWSFIQECVQWKDADDSEFKQPDMTNNEGYNRKEVEINLRPSSL